MSRSKQLALGGALAALILLFMSMARAFPLWDLSMNALTSLCVAVMCIETGYRGALKLIITASALALIFPGPVYALVFAGFFGIYPLVKALLESRLSILTAVLVKIGLVIASVLAVFRIYPPLQQYPERTAEIFREVNLDIGGTLLNVLALMGLVILFLLYDMALTALISLYSQHIRRR